MNFLPAEIEMYAEKFTQPESKILQELNRETNAHVLQPRMLSGHLQGRLLSLISKMIQPSLILEIGTYTGYSAICMAEGLRKEGVLHTIEVNEELKDIILSYITKARLQEKIKLHIGNAKEIIPRINGSFDLIFIDADKENYSAYFDLTVDRTKQGGFIIADNVLWSGNVLKPFHQMDAETKALSEYTEKVYADDRVESLLLPVRDGLLISRKK